MRSFKLFFALFALSIVTSSCSDNYRYYLTSIKINSIPATQGSIPWDDSGGSEPDVFPAIGSSAGVVWQLQNYQTSHLEDATNADLPVTYIIPNLEIDASTRYSAELWDYDYVTNNELMASMNFRPEDLDIGSNPTEVTLTSGDASVTLTFEKEED